MRNYSVTIVTKYYAISQFFSLQNCYGCGSLRYMNQGMEVNNVRTARGRLNVPALGPSVFDYLDYRDFLRAMQEQRKLDGRPASNADFARRGKLESPNYWGLVVSGKRNLSPLTVQKFSKAAGLEGKAALYFENLVYFNQSKRNEDREAYFERLQTLAQGQKSSAFQLLATHVNMLSHWYVIAVRELIGTKSFVEDEAIICKRLKNKIGKKEAREAIEILLTLGFVARNLETKKLIQSEPHINYKEAGANFAIRTFHEQFLDKAKESLQRDAIQDRNMTSTTLSMDWQRFSELKKEVEEFTKGICVKYGTPGENTDAVVQVNTQVFSLTDNQKSQTREGK